MLQQGSGGRNTETVIFFPMSCIVPHSLLRLVILSLSQLVLQAKHRTFEISSFLPGWVTHKGNCVSPTSWSRRRLFASQVFLFLETTIIRVISAFTTLLNTVLLFLYHTALEDPSITSRHCFIFRATSTLHSPGN